MTLLCSLLLSAYQGMLHLRAVVCSGQGERDIDQILIGSGLGSSETFREHAKVHRTLQQNWEKGWQEQ